MKNKKLKIRVTMFTENTHKSHFYFIIIWYVNNGIINPKFNNGGVLNGKYKFCWFCNSKLLW
mgnify:CR=1 FL=1